MGHLVQNAFGFTRRSVALSRARTGAPIAIYVLLAIPVELGPNGVSGRSFNGKVGDSGSPQFVHELIGNLIRLVARAHRFVGRDGLNSLVP